MSNPNQPKNYPADVARKSLELELNNRVMELNELKAKYDALVIVHKKVTDALNEQNRAKVIMKLKEMETTLTDAEMLAMDMDSLLSLLDMPKFFKKTVAGIRARSEDEPKTRPRMTVPNKFRFGLKKDES